MTKEVKNLVIIICIYSQEIDYSSTAEEKKGNFLASIDAYTSYLPVIDDASRYTWIFLTKDKKSPIEIVDNFLEYHGLKSGTR